MKKRAVLVALATLAATVTGCSGPSEPEATPEQLPSPSPTATPQITEPEPLIPPAEDFELWTREGGYTTACDDVQSDGSILGVEDLLGSGTSIVVFDVPPSTLPRDEVIGDRALWVLPEEDSYLQSRALDIADAGGRVVISGIAVTRIELLVMGQGYGDAFALLGSGWPPGRTLLLIAASSKPNSTDSDPAIGYVSDVLWIDARAHSAGAISTSPGHYCHVLSELERIAAYEATSGATDANDVLDYLVDVTDGVGDAPPPIGDTEAMHEATDGG